MDESSSTVLAGRIKEPESLDSAPHDPNELCIG